VTLEWSHPTERENGTYLELSEIGGYEIRVYDSRTAQFTYYDIKGNSTTRYGVSNYTTTMTIEIAVYDTTGLYSEYVPVTN
jgi:hypothetical protein